MDKSNNKIVLLSKMGLEMRAPNKIVIGPPPQPKEIVVYRDRQVSGPTKYLPIPFFI